MAVLKKNAKRGKTAIVHKGVVPYHNAARIHDRRAGDVIVKFIVQKNIGIGIHVVQTVAQIERFVPLDQCVIRVLNVKAVAYLGDHIADKAIALRIPNVHAAPSFSNFQFPAPGDVIVRNEIVLGLQQVNSEKNVPQFISLNFIITRLDQNACVFMNQHSAAMFDHKTFQGTRIRCNGEHAAIAVTANHRPIAPEEREFFIDSEIAVINAGINKNRIPAPRRVDLRL